MGGPKPMYTLVVGLSPETPGGIAVKGGGTFSGASVLYDPGGYSPTFDAPGVEVAADLKSATLTGKAGSVYTVTFNCS